MKDFVKKLDNFLLMAMMIMFYLIILYGCFWFIYKIYAGAYHLLDKLIDKL